MLIHLTVFLAGFAALTWEVLWLHFATLAIGVSAQAAAIILSSMMLGMTAGSLTAAPILKRIKLAQTNRLLGVIEILIGGAGLFVAFSFTMVERLDVWIYHTAPDVAPFIQCVGIIVSLGVPAFLMGMTVPVYASMANQFKQPVATIYASNLFGASVGILAVSFWFIPEYGIESTIKINVCLNILAAFIAFAIQAIQKEMQSSQIKTNTITDLIKYSMRKSSIVVFCTGFSTFALEVLWFRSLRAGLQATTESFALMLFTTLIALAIGGYLAKFLKQKKLISLSCLLAVAGFLVLEVTPIIERCDLYVAQISGPYPFFMLKRFLFVFLTIGPPMCIIGICLPWLLDLHNEPKKVSVLYAINTFGAVVGSLVTAWYLLSFLGIAKSAWIIAGFLFIVSFVLATKKECVITLTLGVVGFIIAFSSDTGLGYTRTQGGTLPKQYTLIDYHEGPDATVSVIEGTDQVRHLYIDGFSASNESIGAHYMEWMGRLPMLLHNDPKNALVICFGTGQTANGVRQEMPEHLDIVDVNPSVFEMATHFIKNQRVLEDSRISKIVMDGRAFLRRTNKNYDVVTLEPMPPTFAGSNSLYSLEFYQLIKSRLNNNGVVAQWVPFHLIDVEQASAIIATFNKVFVDTHLWMDPKSNTGIVLGFNRTSKKAEPLEWYGFKRKRIARSLSNKEISQSLINHSHVVSEFIKSKLIITDDNQFLSYGFGRMKAWDSKK